MGFVRNCTIGVLLFLFANLGYSQTLYSGEGINCGGEVYESDTTFYRPDMYTSGGWFRNDGKTISGTNDQKVFSTYRLGVSRCNVPVLNGRLEVSLLFAETVCTRVGQRKFDITLEDSVTLSNFDILEHVTPDTAYEKTVVVEVSDGELNINFSKINYLPMLCGIKVRYLSVTRRGRVIHKRWNGLPGNQIDTLLSNSAFPESPDKVEYTGGFELPKNTGDYWGSQLKGYIHPPVSGDYTFRVSGDDQVKVLISSDQSPENKTVILYLDRYTGFRQWDKYPDRQVSAPISLSAGEKYYVEVLGKEGGGGDHISLGWDIPGQGFELVDGEYVSCVQASTVLPPAPTAPQAAYQSDTVIGLTWALPPGGSGISSFRLYRNETIILYSDAETFEYRDETVLPSSTYIYTVKAVNVDGMVSTASEPLIVTTSDPVNIGMGTGLTGVYYKGRNFEAKVFSRTDSTVSISSASEFGPEVGSKELSVYWEGDVQPRFSEKYTFYTRSDDGVRLWVNGRLLINQWKTQSAHEYSADMDVVAGRKYRIRLEYFQAGGSARVELKWSSLHESKEVIPMLQLYPSNYAVGIQASVSIPVTSFVSPMWLGGRVGADGTQISALVGESSASVTKLDQTSFFVSNAADHEAIGVQLTDGDPTQITITVSDQEGNSNQVSGKTIWVPFRLNDKDVSSDSIQIRQSESLKLAFDGDEENSIIAMDVDGDGIADVQGAGSVELKHCYTVAGTYFVNVTQDGKPTAGLEVIVAGVDWQGPTACERKFTRLKEIKIVSLEPKDICLRTTDRAPLLIQRKAVNGQVITYGLRPEEREDADMYVHIGDIDGPIIGKQTLNAFDLYPYSYRIIRSLGMVDENTRLLEGNLYIEPHVKDLDIKLHIFINELTFLDSTKVKFVSTNDFELNEDGIAEYRYQMLQTGTRTCHYFEAYQNGVKISNR